MASLINGKCSLLMMTGLYKAEGRFILENIDPTVFNFTSDLVAETTDILFALTARSSHQRHEKQLA